MNLENFNKIKLWYIQYLENNSIIENINLNIDLIANQTFYLFSLGIFKDFFEKLDSPNFEQLVKEKVSSADDKDDIISAILNFKSTFKRYFVSYEQWDKSNSTSHISNNNQSINTNFSKTDEIVIATYQAAKAYYENRIDSKDKENYYKYIQDYSKDSSSKFDKGSSNIYLGVFLKMMHGECFSGNPADKYTKYFLENIYEDFGLDNLNLALISLAQHINKSVKHKISLGDQIAQKYDAKFFIDWDKKGIQ